MVGDVAWIGTVQSSEGGHVWTFMNSVCALTISSTLDRGFDNEGKLLVTALGLVKNIVKILKIKFLKTKFYNVGELSLKFNIYYNKIIFIIKNKL